MAARKKKKKTRKKAGKKATTQRGGRRQRRTPEQIIADLKEKIREVEQRAAAKELKQSPSIRKALSVVRSLDKLIGQAAEEKQTALQHALVDAREPLAAFLQGQGLRLPKARRPRGRRPAA